MDTSFALGLAGVVLSSFALGWNVYRDLSDRGRLRVECNIGSLVEGGSKHDGFVIWQVTNAGRRPIIVAQVGGRLRTRPEYFFLVRSGGSQLPLSLLPGEVGHFWTRHAAELPEPDQIVAFHAQDTLGNQFKVKRKATEAVKDFLRQNRGKL